MSYNISDLTELSNDQLSNSTILIWTYYNRSQILTIIKIDFLSV